MKRYVFIAIALLALILMASTACTEENAKLAEQRQSSVELRAQMMARAEALIPAPQSQNFPLRRVLSEYTRREDLLNHPWYTYIISDTGAITHYFVSTTVPVSTNAFLGSTESIYYSGNGNLVLTAPSLDGIYYGGSGSTSSMNGWIFIDAATGAMGIVYGCKILTFDAPLILQTEPLLIQIAPPPKK